MSVKELDFVKQDKVSLFLDSSIKKLANRNKIRTIGTFDPLALGECNRRIIYRSIGTEKDFSKNDYFDSCHSEFIRKKWLHYIGMSPRIKVLNEEKIVVDANFNIAGTLDAVINIGGHIFSVTFKFVDILDFTKIKEEKPFRKDVIESMVYSWLAETEGGLLVYENKLTQEYEVFHIKRYDAVIQSIKCKCKRLFYDKTKGIIPDRSYKSNKSKECGICEYRNVCWTKNEEQKDNGNGDKY